MSTPQPDIEAQARQIAVEVGVRRKAGEVIADEQILREYPKLRGPLLEQLTRLSRLETARQRVEREQNSEPDVKHSVADDEVIDVLDGSVCDSLAGDTPQPSDQLGTLDLPIEEAPTELGDSQAQLRLTLREPGGEELRNQSTMVLADPIEPDLAAEEAGDNPAVPCYRPSVRAPMAVVKLFYDGQQTYHHYPVMADRFRIGRVEGELVVPHDFWMSGRHAEIQRRKRGDDYHWYLVDLNSTNGTFVQADFAVLHHQDELFLGQERYRFQLQSGRAGLMHVTTGAGQQWWFSSNAVTIGSQLPVGLASFADDPYLDAVHAKLKREPDGTWTIRDNRSRNGVWFRIKEIELPPHAEFQLGEQRFGFWAPTDRPVKASQLHVGAKHKSLS